MMKVNNVKLTLIRKLFHPPIHCLRCISL